MCMIVQELVSVTLDVSAQDNFCTTEMSRLADNRYRSSHAHSALFSASADFYMLGLFILS